MSPEPEYIAIVGKNKHVYRFRNLIGHVSGEVTVLSLSDRVGTHNER